MKTVIRLKQWKILIPFNPVINQHQNSPQNNNNFTEKRNQ